MQFFFAASGKLERDTQAPSSVVGGSLVDQAIGADQTCTKMHEVDCRELTSPARSASVNTHNPLASSAGYKIP